MTGICGGSGPSAGSTPARRLMRNHTLLIVLALFTTGCQTAVDWPAVRSIVVQADAIVGDYQTQLGPADPLTAKLDAVRQVAVEIVDAIDSGQPNATMVNAAIAIANNITDKIDDPSRRQTAKRIVFSVTMALRLAGIPP